MYPERQMNDACGASANGDVTRADLAMSVSIPPAGPHEYQALERRGLIKQGAIVAALTLLALSRGSALAQSEVDYYPARDWQELSAGEVHVSAFVFRDANANGVFDLGDRPLAYAAISLDKQGSRQSMRRSNVSGFANFSGSLTQASAEIRTPGLYGLTVAVPPGWRVTTGNVTQSIEVLELPGAPGDLALVAAAEPIGLAPVPEIRGVVPVTGAVIKASGPRGDATVDLADNAFVVGASPGRWHVELVAPGRPLHIYDRTVGAYPIALPRQPTAELPADVSIGFDDLIGTEAVAAIPGGYGGFTWLNWVVTHNRTYQGEGYVNGTLSGEYVAYNGSGNPAAIERASPFDFVGGYFSVAWARAEGETAHIRAWRGDTLLHEDAVRLSAMGPVYFAAGYEGVTRLEFMTEHSWQLVVDDLGFRTGAALKERAAE